MKSHILTWYLLYIPSIVGSYILYIYSTTNVSIVLMTAYSLQSIHSSSGASKTRQLALDAIVWCNRLHTSTYTYMVCALYSTVLELELVHSCKCSSSWYSCKHNTYEIYVHLQYKELVYCKHTKHIICSTVIYWYRVSMQNNNLFDSTCGTFY